MLENYKIIRKNKAYQNTLAIYETIGEDNFIMIWLSNVWQIESV